MAKFRKKPVVIEAEQFAGNAEQLKEKMDRLGIRSERKEGHVSGKGASLSRYMMDTLEGPFQVHLFDWIITGVKGERYPCKPDIFAATYEEVSP